MKKNVLDCIELQHKGGARLAGEMAGLSSEEKAAYLKKHTDALRRRQRRLRQAKASAAGKVSRRTAA